MLKLTRVAGLNRGGVEVAMTLLALARRPQVVACLGANAMRVRCRSLHHGLLVFAVNQPAVLHGHQPCLLPCM